MCFGIEKASAKWQHQASCGYSAGCTALVWLVSLGAVLPYLLTYLLAHCMCPDVGVSAPRARKASRMRSGFARSETRDEVGRTCDVTTCLLSHARLEMKKRNSEEKYACMYSF